MVATTSKTRRLTWTVARQYTAWVMRSRFSAFDEPASLVSWAKLYEGERAFVLPVHHHLLCMHHLSRETGGRRMRRRRSAEPFGKKVKYVTICLGAGSSADDMSWLLSIMGILGCCGWNIILDRPWGQVEEWKGNGSKEDSQREMRRGEFLRSIYRYFLEFLFTFVSSFR